MSEIGFCKRARVLAGAVSVLIVTSAHGQTFTNLHTFTGETDGQYPLGLAISGNTLYGTTQEGGLEGDLYGNGTVFSVNTDGTGYTILHAFTATQNFVNSDGASPWAAPLISGSTLYGTTGAGGTQDYGTVFSITSNGVFSVLHDLPTGIAPTWGLILSGSTFYGTSQYGGTSGVGTVFSVNTDGTGFTILHSFTGNGAANSDGAEPYAGLVLSNGVLYGTTQLGGSGDRGVIFSVNADGTGFSTLHSFASVLNATVPNADGGSPEAPLLLVGNTLYGVTPFGGTNSNGTLFAVNTDGSGFSVLHSFTSAEGDYSTTPLVLFGNALCGATSSSIFTMSLNGTAFTVLSTASGARGSIVVASNAIYGTSSGAVFALQLPTIPVISHQPQPAVVTVGNTASFTVTASGALPLSYQWAFNSTNITGATNATFALANVVSSNSGTYTVTITNVFGSLTSSPATLTVISTATVTLIADPSNAGVVTGGGTFNIGSQAQISATPNNGWRFSGWNDGNAQNPREITVPSNGVTYIANFASNTAVVTLVAAPSNGGTVSGGGTFQIGVQVQISATANPGWTFTGWNDGSSQNPRTIMVPSNGVAYAASFVTNTAIITLVAVPSSGGTVSGGGTFEIGSQVQISATANDGWAFTGWNDGNMQNPRTVTVQASGASYAASFTFVPISASYSGLFYDSNDIALQSSGLFSLTLTANGTFTAKLLLAGETYPFSGSFSADGLASNSVSISKTNRLTILLGFDSGGRDILSGQISGANWTSELVANRAVYSKTNLAPQAGKYTVLVPGSSNAAQPGGDGFGTITVDHYGNLNFSGTLGDGSSVSQTAVVSAQGQWPFYVSLYSGKGSILGWLTFASEPASDIAGAAVWTKLPQPTAKFYPAGFTNQTEVVGSSFRFTNGVPVLSFAAGELWLTNGDLPQSLTNQFTLAKSSKVTDTNKMSLTISTATGRFTGSVVNPATKKTIPIYGAVLQKQNLGLGCFLGTNESGEVFLGPVP